MPVAKGCEAWVLGSWSTAGLTPDAGGLYVDDSYMELRAAALALSDAPGWAARVDFKLVGHLGGTFVRHARAHAPSFSFTFLLQVHMVMLMVFRRGGGVVPARVSESASLRDASRLNPR